jgi:formate dehydrogenase (coenzyme F420) beta subunit
MDNVTRDIRRAVAGLFAEKKIDRFIGHEKGSVPPRSRPAFLARAEETERLVWDGFCSNNLAVYLPSIYLRQGPKKGNEPPLPRTGLLLKGCDMRSLVALAKEHQVPRESVVVVGVPCAGMVSLRKLSAAVGGEEIREAVEADGSVRVSAGGRTVTLRREETLEDGCLSCRSPVPEGADVMIQAGARPAGDGGEGILADFAALARTERWARFRAEMARCIRCYACRQACPTCYCKVCFAEENNPAWIGAGSEVTDAMIFHMIRIYHQAGRCVECDACVRACPMGIDLRTLTKKMAADVREMFGFTPGFDIAEKPPLCTFREDDGQAFITEPSAMDGARASSPGTDNASPSAMEGARASSPGTDNASPDGHAGAGKGSA